MQFNEHYTREDYARDMEEQESKKPRTWLQEHYDNGVSPSDFM